MCSTPGTGNLHPCISYDGRDPDEKSRVLAASRELLTMCVRLGGVLSGEHGVGIEKRDALDLVFGEADLEGDAPGAGLLEPGAGC